MNPITVFLTLACLAVGAGLGATGHLYAGIPLGIAAIIIASALKMANTRQKFVILRAGKLRGVNRRSSNPSDANSVPLSSLVGTFA
ncbi:MAG: hypothetical protein ABSC37_12790 [Xanthobacteraceae bacterium]|jgi:thiazole synthase ThiGH ThiG subunit